MSTIYGIYRERILRKPELLELWESARSAKARAREIESGKLIDTKIIEVELHHAYRSRQKSSAESVTPKLCLNSNPTPLTAA